MPLARSVASVRWGFSPNSGQSRRSAAFALEAAGTAPAAAVGVETASARPPPHAATVAHAPASTQLQIVRAAGIADFLAQTRCAAAGMLRASAASATTGARTDGQDTTGRRAGT